MSSRKLNQAGSRPTPPLTSETTVAPAARTPVPTRVQYAVIDQTVTAGEGGDHLILSDDSVRSEQIQATHAPVSQELDVSPVLFIVEDILRLARPLTDEHTIDATATDAAVVAGTQTPAADVNDKPVDTVRHDGAYQNSSYLDTDIVKVLAYPINKVACEIICKSSGGREPHQVTMDILKSLSSFSWDAKLVIAFAGFAIQYGQFWLVEHHYTNNPLAKHIATLKDLANIMDHSSELREQFEEVLKLLEEILKVTNRIMEFQKVTQRIIEFKKLHPLYISKQSPEITAATAHIPTAVYWCIRGLVVCAVTLLNLTGGGHEYITSTSVLTEIPNLAHDVSLILDHLETQMKILLKSVDAIEKEEVAYTKFKQLLSTAHIDNNMMKVLTAFFSLREDEKPIYDGTKKEKERLDVLGSKYVLLLISDLKLQKEELSIIHSIHNYEHKNRKKYDILWLPIADPMITMTPEQDSNIFYDLRDTMPWFSVDHPSVVEPGVIRYIKEDLGFTRTPMLVVLDRQGKISNHDVLPMIRIWGAKAFPFTKDRESELWDENEWNIDLIANIDPRIPEWISKNRVICLYGGDNIEWIKKFTEATTTAAGELKVPLEMLYVGRRKVREKVQEYIAGKGLKHIDNYYAFWVRLASIWHSKTQMGKTVDDDNIMKGILDLLTFDSAEQGWAIFSRGNSREIAMAIGEKVLQVLKKYKDWVNQADISEKFVTVLGNHLRDLPPTHHCVRLILPGQAGYIPERLVCSECQQLMDKYVMYRCCSD